MTPRSKKLIFMAPLAILGMLLFVAIGGTLVQQLWNWLLPSLFGLRRISFWQALGLLALCRILFGASGRRCFQRSQMTPEQRERFRQGMRRRFGFGPAAGESKEP